MNISRGTFDYVFIDLSNTQVPFYKMGPFLEKCFHLNFVRKVKCSCIDKFFHGSCTINVYFCPTEIKGFSSLKSLTE